MRCCVGRRGRAAIPATLWRKRYVAFSADWQGACRLVKRCRAFLALPLLWRCAGDVRAGFSACIAHLLHKTASIYLPLSSRLLAHKAATGGRWFARAGTGALPARQHHAVFSRAGLSLRFGSPAHTLATLRKLRRTKRAASSATAALPCAPRLRQSGALTGIILRLSACILRRITGAGRQQKPARRLRGKRSETWHRRNAWFRNTLAERGHLCCCSACFPSGSSRRMAGIMRCMVRLWCGGATESPARLPWKTRLPSDDLPLRRGCRRVPVAVPAYRQRLEGTSGAGAISGRRNALFFVPLACLFISWRLWNIYRLAGGEQASSAFHGSRRRICAACLGVSPYLCQQRLFSGRAP